MGIPSGIQKQESSSLQGRGSSKWFIDDDTLLEDIENKFKIDSTIYNQKILLSYFSNLFNCTEDKEEIDTILNDLFFDEYTHDLYTKCYNINFNIRTLINYSLKKESVSNISFMCEKVILRTRVI